MAQELAQSVGNILRLDTNKLKRESGDFQFTDVTFELEKLYLFTNDLRELPSYFESLPDDRKDALTNQLELIDHSLSQINEFRPQEISEPAVQRNTLAQQVKSAYAQLYPYVESLDVAKLKSAGSQATLSNITQEAKNALKQAQESKKELDKLVASTKTVAIDTSVEEYQGIFSEQANKNKRMAGFIAVFAVITAIVISIYLYIVTNQLADIIKNADPLRSSQIVIAVVIQKLFILAVMLFFIQVIIRTFFANLHQSTVNRHRENSLRVFNALVESAKDQGVKDQVLTLLSKTIFEAGDTGFIPGKDLSREAPDVVAFVKDIGKYR